MGVLNESKEFYETFKKDKNIMLAFKIIIWGVIILCFLNVVIYFVDRSHNHHAKMLWGMSEYFPDTMKNENNDTKTIKILMDSDSSKKNSVEYKKEPLIFKHNDRVKEKNIKKTSVANKNKKTRVDTTKRGESIKQENVHGDNQSNLNNGTNNGIIGNNGTIINTEKTFTEQDGKNMLDTTRAVTIEKNITSKCVRLDIANNSNAAKIIPKMKEYLAKHGFIVQESIVFYTEVFNGIFIVSDGNCIVLKIGTI